MSVLNPRNRLVNFRLSEVEYEELKTACHASGARSISEFARNAVLRRIAGPDRDTEAASARMREFEERIRRLEDRMEQLFRAISLAGMAGALQVKGGPSGAGISKQVQQRQ